ncbi:MAG: hypothetical protein PHW12_06995, partial [Smithella sp.]|nr:hypothetical protein [Smithella sp.]
NLFNPIKLDEVTMRTCGPTIHDTPHLGNYRRMVVWLSKRRKAIGSLHYRAPIILTGSWSRP